MKIFSVFLKNKRGIDPTLLGLVFSGSSPLSSSTGGFLALLAFCIIIPFLHIYTEGSIKIIFTFLGLSSSSAASPSSFFAFLDLVLLLDF